MLFVPHSPRLPRARLFCAGLVLAGTPMTGSTAGFALTEFSVRGMGSSYAGVTAGGDDAGTIYWNPAGLTRLSGTRFEGNAVLVDFKAMFRDAGSSQTLLANPGPPPAFVQLPSRGPDDDGGGYAVTPSAYITHALTDALTVGVGVHVPFGLQTKYDNHWKGRYHAIKSRLTTVDINPSVGYQLSERWALGAGLSLQYIDASLSQAVFTGGADGRAEVRGDDWSVGFNLGLLYTASDATRVGVAFRSGIDHTLRGSQQLVGVGPASATVDASTPLDLPANVAVGFVHQWRPRWTVMGDVTWTGWRSFKEIRVSADGFPDAVTTADWDDTWRVSLGLAFEASADWTLRGGVMFDQSPIPDAHARTPRIPGADRYWGSLGASWRLSRQLTVDFAYSHLFFKDADIDNTLDLAPTAAPGAFTDHLVGSTDAGVDALGLGLRYQFD